ncbi:IS5 family transposase [Streptomyces sp. NPDC088752]|uniref:IS5 family transposase n=1 Tax=Streptomyces sp. NPDC088752 TaxID=3154963 RepID=UPI003445A497
MADAEWAVVRTMLPVPAWMDGRGGRPESYCHRQMVDAVRYLVDNGIKWRAMPADLPPWDRVYAFFRRWRENALTREFHDRLRERVREAEGRDAEPTAGIVDSQSVKGDAVVDAASRGFDGGKLVNGRKRHLVVDCLGLVLAVLVTPASVTDRNAASGMLLTLRECFRRLRLIWADGAYTGDVLTEAAHRLGLRLDIVRRSDDSRGFTVLPRRWVVERTFAWLMRCRRLARDYERRSDTSEAVVLWSMTMVMSRRLARHATRRQQQRRNLAPTA